ncbi:helix-turn-helix domain-containing protein [Streptomyces sp.]|uniref:helix-turn-helix domain-containing protein n=1 Tax=Streptomyces sp. TaxID=1931 RepID=UPI002F3F5B2F
MGQWEPLAEGIPVDVRRLATQLRRMKDRSGLTVPALAARTAEPAETWSRALAGRHLPPLAAVEVLAQASGADYDRVAALWHLAEVAGKGATGRAERRGRKPLPSPDPLDPLGPEEGVPAGRRGFLLLAAVGVVAAAALAGVMLTAGASTGRAPVPPGAAPTFSVADTPSAPGGASPSSPDAGTSRAAAPGGPAAGRATPDRAPSRARPVPSSSLSPTASVAPDERATVTPTGTASAPPSSSPSPRPSPSSPSSLPLSPSSPASPTAGPIRPGPCVDVIIIGVCLG